MKKIMLLLALCLGFVVQAFAIDSTALFDNKVLGTDIGKSSTGGVPVGTIIAWPASSNPEDPENWLECNGQTISPMTYLELFAVVGSRVPDMRNQFMRGGTSAEVGQVAADSTRSHVHTMDQHSHTYAGKITYVDNKWWAAYSGWNHQNAESQRPGSGPDRERLNHVVLDNEANVEINNNMRFSGTTDLGGPLSTHASGSSETAPQHIRVRYLIRALP